MTPRFVPTLGALVLATCTPGAEVNHDGEYTLFPSADNVDTNIYPLRHLLVIEDNVHAGQTLVYYFRGDLPSADLGFSDLWRLSRAFNRYDVAFVTPHATHADAIAELDPDEDRIRLANEDGAIAELMPLDEDSLRPTGASRFLRALSTNDFEIAAYAGVVDEALVADELLVGHGEVRFAPKLEGASLNISLETKGGTAAGDDAQLQATLDPGELHGPDYLIAELTQPIVRLEDLAALDAGVVEHTATDAGVSSDDSGLRDAGLGDAGLGDAGMPEAGPLDSLMRTRYLPDLRYVVTPALMTRGFEGGCWSLNMPLALRFVQVKRDYQSTTEGDLAVIHRRFDQQTVPTDIWHPLLEEPELAEYCEQYTSYPPARPPRNSEPSPDSH